MTYMDTSWAFIRDIQELMDKYGLNGDIIIENNRISDGFYEKNSSIYDAYEGWEDDIEVDKKAWLTHEYELRMDFPIEEVPFLDDVVVDWLEYEMGMSWDDLDSYLWKYGELTLDDLKDEFPNQFENLINRVINEIDEKDFYELEEYLEPLYGIDGLDEFETLSDWTVYFRPAIWNEDIAWECGLFPFEYKGEGYLALGGCGMDLSPKLDAYQALTAGSVSSGSQFLRQPEYAKYVVGDVVFDKVMAAIKCPPKVCIYIRNLEDN